MCACVSVVAWCGLWWRVNQLSHAVLVVYTSAMAMGELQMFAEDNMFRVSPYSSCTNRIFVG